MQRIVFFGQRVHNDLVKLIAGVEEADLPDVVLPKGLRQDLKMLSQLDTLAWEAADSACRPVSANEKHNQALVAQAAISQCQVAALPVV